MLWKYWVSLQHNKKKRAWKRVGMKGKPQITFLMTLMLQAAWWLGHSIYHTKWFMLAGNIVHVTISFNICSSDKKKSKGNFCSNSIAFNPNCYLHGIWALIEIQGFYVASDLLNHRNPISTWIKDATHRKSGVYVLGI